MAKNSGGFGSTPSIQAEAPDKITEVSSEGKIFAPLNHDFSGGGSHPAYILIPLSRNYDSFYLNPDLESLLNTRGFSTKRGEIIGMFNYIAPLSKGQADDPSGEYIINPSGELYDYQCQLKQLRYEDANNFFKEMVGIRATIATMAGTATQGHNPFIIRNDLTEREREQAEVLLQSYNDNVDVALTVLDYLTVIYNAVSYFIDCQGLSTLLDPIDRDKPNSTWPTTLIDAIHLVTPTPLTLSPTVTPTLGSNFNQFLNIHAGDAMPTAGSMINFPMLDLIVRQQYGADSPTRIISGTWSMLSMINFFASCLKGVSAYPIIAHTNNLYPIESYGKTLPGTSRFTVDDTDGSPAILRWEHALSLRGEFQTSDTQADLNALEAVAQNLGLGAVTAREITDIYNPDTLLSVEGSVISQSSFSAGTHWRRIRGTASDGSYNYAGGLSDIAYLIGLDTIQGHCIATANGTPVGGVPTSTGPSALEVIDRFITNFAGRDIEENQQMLYDLPTTRENFTRMILPFNDDTDSDTSNRPIETFTSTNFLLSEGVESSRSGRSYYCDDVVTKEINEVRLRLQKLTGNMSELGTNISDCSRMLFKPKANNAYTKNYETWGFDKDSPDASFITPGSVVDYVVGNIADIYTKFLSSDQHDAFKADPTYLVPLVISSMAAQDPDVEHLVICYNMAYHKLQKEEITQAEFEKVQRTLVYYVVETICDDAIKGEINSSLASKFYNYKTMHDGDKKRSGQLIDNSYNKTSSALAYYPAGHGMPLSVEGGGATEVLSHYDEDDGSGAYNDTGTVRVALHETWQTALNAIDPKENLLLIPFLAYMDFEADVRQVRPSVTTRSNNYSTRGWTTESRMAGMVKIWKAFISKSACTEMRFQKWLNNTSPKEEEKKWWQQVAQALLVVGAVAVTILTAGMAASLIPKALGQGIDWSIVNSIWYYHIVINKRALASFINFSTLVTNEQSPGLNLSGYNLLTLKSGSGYNMLDLSCFEAVDDYKDTNWYAGHSRDIENVYNLYAEIQDSNLAKNLYAMISAGFVCSAADRIIDASTGLMTAVEGNNMNRDQYNFALKQIRSDPDFQSASLLSITRDQLSLNRALFDSFSVPNRNYPYLPASKAIMVNQTKNLSGFLKNDLMVDNNSDFRRFIGTVGLPAGLLETLRNRMMDETGNLDYRHSSIVEVAIWKRDLLKEDVVYEPQRYVFDTSRHLIYGRPMPTDAGSHIDSAMSAPEPQDFEQVANDIVFRKYTPDGNIATFEGSAYDKVFESESAGVSTSDIFRNHANDYYLKLFMRLTTGIDVSEDIFPFLEGNVFFDDVDPRNQDLYEELALKAKSMFVDTNNIESALNYDRLIGEIRRSIFLSSEKYRNRILYPKVFERTFCMIIDPESFVRSSSNNKSILNKALWTSDIDASVVFNYAEDKEHQNKSGTYSQYYATISLKPAFEEANSDEIIFLDSSPLYVLDGTLTGSPTPVQPSRHTQVIIDSAKKS